MEVCLGDVKSHFIKKQVLVTIFYHDNFTYLASLRECLLLWKIQAIYFDSFRISYYKFQQSIRQSIFRHISILFFFCETVITDGIFVLQTFELSIKLSPIVQSYHQDNWEGGKDGENHFENPERYKNAFDFIFRDCLTSHTHKLFC